MKENPSLGYSLALYLATVMWIGGTVGWVTLIGGEIFFSLKSIHVWVTMDELDLSREESRLAREEEDEGRIRWRQIYLPLDEVPWLPLPFIVCCCIAGVGTLIRKQMGEPYRFVDLFR
ncbi:MAG: hypothetical protein VX949_02435 [Planctomycetota bacterium]|nr:hypothetical protein [Planctomycetota bacterium]